MQHPIRDDLRTYHTLMGLHSNIPQCCIDFFVSQSGDNLRAYNKLCAKADKDLFGKFGYVPCPVCWDRRDIKKVHICLPDNQNCRSFYSGLDELGYLNEALKRIYKL